MNRKITGDEQVSTMTIRQEFAKSAMQGFISDFELMQYVDLIVKEKGLKPERVIAVMAVTQADSLIAALNKERNEKT